MAFFILLWGMAQICLNGTFLPYSEPVLLASNRGYRYGDGLFETLKVKQGKIVLAHLHFERLFSGLKMLNFEVPVFFTSENLEQQIVKLSQKNKCEKLARIRLSCFAGNGGLYDGERKLQYLIECWPLDEAVTAFNDNGLIIGIYPVARKSCDQFSNIKSASFLPYLMAADYAKQNKLNDCLVLNTHDRLADSTIANLFLIKSDTVVTPPLTEGCVNGVMRRYLLEKLKEAGFSSIETPVSREDLENADETFLTNAIRGIRWVKSFGNKTYSNTKTLELFTRFVKTI